MVHVGTDISFALTAPRLFQDESKHMSVRLGFSAVLLHTFAGCLSVCLPAYPHSAVVANLFAFCLYYSPVQTPHSHAGALSTTALLYRGAVQTDGLTADRHTVNE